MYPNPNPQAPGPPHGQFPQNPGQPPWGHGTSAGAPPPRVPSAKSKGNWFLRHKIVTGAGIGVLAFGIGAANNVPEPEPTANTVAIRETGEPSTRATEPTPSSAPTTVTPTPVTPSPTTPPAPVTPAPTTPAPIPSISGGQYKVGVDMAPGEYVIVGKGYYEVSSDSSGTFEAILYNDNYENRTIVNVEAGQYFDFDGRAYTWENAPKVAAQDGVLPDGMYKVGVDLPAGEYKVVPSGSGYYEVRDRAGGDFDGIVANDNFDGEKYLTVTDGQYLKLSRASLRLP